MADTLTDRDLKEKMVQYPSGGVTVRAFAVAPPVKERRPAIIVVQEWWGLNDHMKDVGRRLAKEGYVVLVPDLFSRLGNRVTTDANEAGKLMNALQQTDGLKDLQASIAFLKTAPEVDAAKIGVMGFCMGGSYALMLPCVSADVKAAVPFYGQVPNPDTPLQNLACPILYIYGEEDGWITKTDVQRLANALKKYNKPGEIKTYPGASHAFFNDTRKEVYKPAESNDAWNRAVAFFRQHLG
ncbi:MAG: dienelactone hydrolase family protein [Nitrospirales bacterium]